MSYAQFDYKVQTDYNKKHLAARFQELHKKKNSIITRCEDYADWTLPGVFPKSTQTDTVEISQSMESLGARGVNHLSNKLVMTLFQTGQPFFRIKISSNQIKELDEAAKAGDTDAEFMLANIDTILSESEKEAMTILDYNRYRTEATTTAKLLIITGNALLYHPESKNGKVQTYNLRDYCIVRDLSGNILEIITRDCKAFNTFNKKIQDQLHASKDKDQYKSDTDVTIYTSIKLGDDDKYHMTQGADNLLLDSTGTWTKDTVPWITLTWNLYRGEDYGRGLVEDYAGAFHALDVLTNAQIKAVAIAAEIKFGVDPASVVDIPELNKSKSGTYHHMKRDDVFALQLDKQMDLQTVSVMITRLEKQLTTAFLLNSAVQRDAERVTAEEIRYVAQEIETAYGGIYSRFAEEWQLREAILLLNQINIPVKDTIFPVIITGLDALSNAGEMNNLEMFIRDLSLLQAVPEDIRTAIDLQKYAVFCAVRRGVDVKKLIKTPEPSRLQKKSSW